MVCVGCLFISSCSNSPKDKILNEMEDFADWYEDQMETAYKTLSSQTSSSEESMGNWGKLMDQGKEIEKKRGEILEMLQEAEKSDPDLEKDEDFLKKVADIEQRIQSIDEKYTKKLYNGD